MFDSLGGFLLLMNWLFQTFVFVYIKYVCNCTYNAMSVHTLRTKVKLQQMSLHHSQQMFYKREQSVTWCNRHIEKD